MSQEKKLTYDDVRTTILNLENFRPFNKPLPRPFSEIIDTKETLKPDELIFEIAFRSQILFGSIIESSGLDQSFQPVGRASPDEVEKIWEELDAIKSAARDVFIEAAADGNQVIADFLENIILSQFGFNPLTAKFPEEE